MHAIQVEFARALYMDEETLERRPGLETLAADMTHLAAALARDLHDMTAES
jgi:N-formylglutamate amidohydrolase